jgi:uncharacterized phage protein (TIGR02220 family)
MARIRTVKPDFWTDEKMVELSFETRLFFIGLWNFVDDEGRIQYSPKKLKMLIFPADSVDVPRMIQELSANGRVIVYQIDGIEYLQVINFAKHQRIDKRSDSKLPPPPTSAESPRLPPTPSDSPRIPESRAESPRTPTTEGNGREGNGKEEKQTHVGLAPDPARQKKAELRKTAAEIINFLNAKAGRSFDANGANADFVVARLKEGATVEDLRAVVAKKCRDWKGDEKMSAYLRPETLFGRTKFASYKGELGAA